ncbi:LCP family protein [Corynebacterium felinum]|uniref:LCP family protein required for cell wall assembly n=1 Tax=Corynebacterium felinum TaxID=131318 RepID=A0ABU2B8F8_9CORY|nr:LCP family protein [Corynebacterium felinum]MDF5820251.1 LCP family protein [Corynebacterium felinum]MDR7354893.1 LCP family protein required for cell wall assembly [Corynebacterium felinum]WJY94253.1 Transcriptional regulator LytR [Corynebacterium felinum]
MSETSRRPVRDIKAPPTSAPVTKQQGPAAVKAFVAFLSALVLVVSGVGYFTVGRIGNTVASAGSLELGGDQGVKNQAKDGAVDILLVGSDSRSDAQGNPLTPEEIAMLHAGDEEADNTDTIMVIRIPNDGSSATAISIPRDTYVSDPELGNTKINGVYAGYKAIKKSSLFNSGVVDEQQLEEQSKDAGRKGLIDAVTDLTGITVDHYAEIGLLGFVLLTDAVGGVDVCLNNAVFDEFSGANFPAGVQTLGGAQGLAFVRQRHGLPRGDLDRIVRQQAFMASLVNKVLSTGTLTSPSKLSSLGDAVTRSVIIDKDWDVMSFATQLQNLAGGNVRFNTIPVTSIDGVGDYGESVVTVDVSEVHAFFKALLGDADKALTDTPTSETPRPQSKVKVLNASAISGLAAGISGHLTTLGYHIAETGNAEEGLYNRTQVVARSDGDREALIIAKELGGLPVVADPTLEPGIVLVVAGADYDGPTGTPTASTPTSTSVSSGTSVGQPGHALGEEQISPVIDAGGNGPRCIN